MSEDKYILVIADGSKEMNVALQYACARSKKTDRKIIIATFIEPLDVLTTQGVTEIMQNEAREEAEKKLQYASSVVKESTGILPVLHIREGFSHGFQDFLTLTGKRNLGFTSRWVIR